MAKTPVARAGKERFQVVPGSIGDLVSPVLRDRSTPVQ
jgi:hypothetical protein